MRTCLIVLLALYCACPIHARPQSGFYSEPALDELRIEIDDLKAAFKTTQVELNLLDERLKKQDNLKGNLAIKETNSVTLQLSALERKVANLEKTLEKVANDLRTLSSTASQALSKIQGVELDLVSHDKRLDEVAKLKGTLTNISKAISQKSVSESTSSAKSYRVKAGDSLEKIARSHSISVDTLRKLNALSNDKILIGQELRLPDDNL